MRRLLLVGLTLVLCAAATAQAARVFKPVSLRVGEAQANRYAATYDRETSGVISHSRVYDCDPRYDTQVVCYAEFRWNDGDLCARYISVRRTVGVWYFNSGPKGCTGSSTSSGTTAPSRVIGPGNGYPVVCRDGAISNSGGIQGACSHHGGVGP